MSEAARRQSVEIGSGSFPKLVCTQDGIFLWPGTPLLTKLGGRFAVRPRDRVYDLVCRLHGPRAAWTPLIPVLERAAGLLSEGRIEAARACLDRLSLPPLTRAGADLAVAIAKRLGVVPPATPVARDDTVRLRLDLAEALAAAYDGAIPGLWPFAKAPGDDFDAAHPRLGGPPNPGWFMPVGAAKPSAPPNFKRFFDTVYAPLSRAAKQLGLPEDYLLGLSAHESGHLDDHNFEINNPLGLTHAGGRNASYPSIDRAVDYWMGEYGGQVRGATSPEDFASRMEGMRDGRQVPGWKVYNSRDPYWKTKVVRNINSIGRHKQDWKSDN